MGSRSNPFSQKGRDRNKPCSCGSGLKAKRCHDCGSHLSTMTAGIEMAHRQSQMQWFLAQQEERERLRQRHQGLGRPIISVVLGDGTRVVAVGRRRFRGRWKTFPDFLMHYIKVQFESVWGNAELAKPAEDRHPLLNLYQQVCSIQREAVGATGEIYESRITGAVSIFVGLAYNLYCVEHNASTQPVWERWLHRLRTKNDFDAACYEAMAAGAFARAGFVIDFDDDTALDSRHVEFIVTHPRTGRRFAVECKRRNHNEGTKPREVKHLNKAIGQNETGLPLIAFIELGRPVQYSRGEGFPEHLLGAVRRLELHARSEQADKFPPVYVMLTNQPQAHFPDEVVGFVGYLHGFKIPGMEFRQTGPLEDLLAARDAHPEIHELLRSFNEHSHFPNTFDGQERLSERGLRTPLDYYDFVYGAYSETPRQQLLEFMKNWPNQEELVVLEQQELARRYSIHWACMLIQHVKQSRSSD